VLVYLASGEGRAAFEQVPAPEERAPVTSLAPPAPPPPPPGVGRSGSRAGDEHGGADSPAEETREVQPADRERPASGPPDDWAAGPGSVRHPRRDAVYTAAYDTV